MLLDRVHAGINDRAAVEGADRKPDPERLDQEAHADGRAAGGDGEADPGVVQPLHRRLAGISQAFVLGQQGAVDIGYHDPDTGHAWLNSNWLMIRSTITSISAS